MAGSVGNITTDIIKSGLIFNIDAANRASTIPSISTTTAYNTLDSSITATLYTDSIWTNSTVSPSFNTDGTDGYISVNNYTGFNGLNQFTVNFWVQATSNNAGVVFDSPLTLNDSNTLYISFLQWFNSTTEFKFRVVTDGGATDLTINFGSSFFDSTWKNITLYYDGSFMKVFQNGISIASTAKTGTMSVPSTADLYLMKSYGDNIMIGNINGVQVYNRALSANEVLHNYNALKGRFE